MGKKEADDLSDILGTETQEDRKAAKSARLKALAPTSKENDMAKAKGKEAKEVEAKPARATKDAKGEKASTKPVKAKKAKSNGASERGSRPTVEQRAALGKQIVAKIRKPMTCSEADEVLGCPGGWARQSARALVAEGRYTLKKNESGRLVLAPKGK